MGAITVPANIAPWAWVEMDASPELTHQLREALGPQNTAKVFPPDEIVPNQWGIYQYHSPNTGLGRSYAEAVRDFLGQQRSTEKA